MTGTFDVVTTTLGSAVASAATFNVNYPDNRDAGDYQGGFDHQVVSNLYGALEAKKSQISMAFGTSNITITNNSGATLAVNTKLYVQLDRAGADAGESALADTGSMAKMSLIEINLGAPDVADPNGAVASQAATAASGLATGINGALASGGVATFDVPRNVVAAWTTTAVLTVTGTDENGNVIVESSASGVAMAGKKAFKTITAVATSVDITGLTVGSGDVLGLPAFLSQIGHVIAELEDGAAATAGTVVAGTVVLATATTGDVRGTYDPNSAADGAKAFQLIVAMGDTSALGVPQYAG